MHGRRWVFMGRRAVEILSIERGLREEAEVLRMVSEGLP
jgi:hypothetical protein